MAAAPGAESGRWKVPCSERHKPASLRHYSFSCKFLLMQIPRRWVPSRFAVNVFLKLYWESSTTQRLESSGVLNTVMCVYMKTKGFCICSQSLERVIWPMFWASPAFPLHHNRGAPPPSLINNRNNNQRTESTRKPSFVAVQFPVGVTRWCCGWRKQRRRTGTGKRINGPCFCFCSLFCF